MSKDEERECDVCALKTEGPPLGGRSGGKRTAEISADVSPLHAQKRKGHRHHTGGEKRTSGGSAVGVIMFF